MAEESSNNNVLRYRKKIFDKIGSHQFEGKRVLDVGCGDGGDVRFISEYAGYITGIDNKADAAWVIQKNNKFDFQIGDACRLPFEDNIFDVVFAKDALHHIEAHNIALSEMIRVTKSGGKIIILEGNRYNPISYINMTIIQGHQHLTKKYFKKLISSLAERVSFATVESRVWPFKNNLFLPCFNFFEWVMEKVTFLNNYNLAIIEKI